MGGVLKLYDMDNLQEKLAELKTYIGKTDEESKARFDSLSAEIKAMKLTDEEKTIFSNFMMQGLEDISNSMDVIERELRIREQLKEAVEILPLAYIARNYFGKSASWLYQRINGYKVRGKVSTLNHEEIGIFNRALKEIYQGKNMMMALL